MTWSPWLYDYHIGHGVAARRASTATASGGFWLECVSFKDLGFGVLGSGLGALGLRFAV